MKITKYIVAWILFAGLTSGVQNLRAEEDHKSDKAEQKDANAKSYPLDTCVVSDEKLGEHGKAYVFTYKGQEIQLCCKDCLKDFKKDPKKYVKKIEEAEKAKK